MNSIRRAVALSLLQRYAAFVIQFATSIVLARLLSPAETGIFSLAAAVAGIAQMFRDFGVSEYVIQEKDLTRDRMRSALGMTYIMSWLAAILLALAANPIASFYGEAGVANVAYVLALNFLLIPIGSTAFAVLTKRLAFGLIFRIQTGSALVGAVACIVLAARGHSYMSMAWSSLASLVVTILLLAWITPSETFVLPRFAGLRNVAVFGGSLTLGRLADQLSRRCPDFFIGAHLGFSAVGINSKAATLLEAFNDFIASGITRVAVPAFAREAGDRRKSCSEYLRASGIILVLPFAFFAFCGVFAQPIIYLMFGPQWLPAAQIIHVASVGNFLAAPYLLASPVLTASGKVQALLRMQLIGAAFYIPAIYLGAHFSLLVIAIAASLASIPRFYLVQRALSQHFGLHASLLARASARSCVVAVVGTAAAMPCLLLYDYTTLGALKALLLGGAVLLIVGTFMMHAVKHPLLDEIRGLLVGVRRSFKARGQGAP